MDTHRVEAGHKMDGDDGREDRLVVANAEAGDCLDDDDSRRRDDRMDGEDEARNRKMVA